MFFSASVIRTVCLVIGCYIINFVGDSLNGFYSSYSTKPVDKNTMANTVSMKTPHLSVTTTCTLTITYNLLYKVPRIGKIVRQGQLLSKEYG